MTPSLPVAPEFWNRDGPTARLLGPAGYVVRTVGSLRRRLVRRTSFDVPVICVGNLVVGGAGKTPVSQSIAQMLAGRGHGVALLLRGYGGRLRGPVRVAPARHSVRDVGDEALMLSRHAPVWIARNRVEGVRATERAGAGVVVMDDGFQNPALRADLNLLVIDGDYGVGNGRVMPAGPLREPVATGMARADAVVLITPDRVAVSDLVPPGLPVLRAAASAVAPTELAPGTPVFGFAGIGRPVRFRNSLEALGLDVRGFRPFPDHYPYGREDVDRLLATAAELGAVPVTTAKDHIRLDRVAASTVACVDLDLDWQDRLALAALVEGTVSNVVG
ncbi:MAG: tetraacyldisaccharide 4'-kinase [Alphaproteobacteria bacterium]|nr:tetraacyldisaccharide 4'-kinase [Alphaproteobacteria bacterium]